MESLIKEIYSGINSKNVDELKQSIKEWREEFKSKDISVYALETLLKHYSVQYPSQSSEDKYGFINVSQIDNLDRDDDAKIVKLRSELQSLKQRSNEYQKQLKATKTHLIILAVVLTLSICLNLYYIL